MHRLLACAALSAALATTASAGDPDWAFKPGQSWTWECKTEFHYVAMPLTTVVDGRLVRRGGNFGSGGAGNTSASGRSSDPQWEIVTLRGTVLSVDKDGAAHIEFMVENASIEVRFDSNGDHAAWTSRKSATTTLTGFKPYEAMVGFRFEALVGPDGTVRDLQHADWPAASPNQPLPGQEREERAAAAAHRPTAARSWLNLIFATSPDRKAEWKRTIQLPEAERVEARANGKEPIGRVSCVRTKLKMEPAPRETRTVRTEQNVIVARTLENVSLEMVANGDKRGHNWFSRELGCTVKVDLYSQSTINMAGTLVTASFKWEVALKEIGKSAPAFGPELPPGGLEGGWDDVTPTEDGATTVLGAR